MRRWYAPSHCVCHHSRSGSRAAALLAGGQAIPQPVATAAVVALVSVAHRYPPKARVATEALCHAYSGAQLLELGGLRPLPVWAVLRDLRMCAVQREYWGFTPRS